jgi:hypothetical protein
MRGTHSMHGKGEKHTKKLCRRTFRELETDGAIVHSCEHSRIPSSSMKGATFLV